MAACRCSRLMKSKVFRFFESQPAIWVHSKSLCTKKTTESPEPQGDFVSYAGRNKQENNTDQGYPNVTVSNDPEEWKFVERLLPLKTIPEPPSREAYPTPSGWFPQFADPSSMPYWVNRTKNHMMPVYLKKNLGRPLMTVIGRIDGDIWLLNEELIKYIKTKTGTKEFVLTQVMEVLNLIRIYGNYVEVVSEFLKEKGL